MSSPPRRVTEEQIAAAQLRIVLDEKLGRQTPNVVRRIAAMTGVEAVEYKLTSTPASLSKIRIPMPEPTPHPAPKEPAHEEPKSAEPQSQRDSGGAAQQVAYVLWADQPSDEPRTGSAPRGRAIADLLADLNAGQHLAVDAVVAFVDGELGLVAQDRAAAHLAVCQSCAAEVAMQRQARSMVRSAQISPIPADLLVALRAIAQHADVATSQELADAERRAVREIRRWVAREEN